MKTYVIHMISAVERDELVNTIVNVTGATLFDAICIQGDGIAGCMASHTHIYKSLGPEEDVLVFEDDCEIIDPSFMYFIEHNKHAYDIIYIGTNHTFYTPSGIGSWGTHAMWISPKAIRNFLQHTATSRGVDNIWVDVEHIYKLNVWRPPHPYTYVIQKRGLISYVNGTPRV